MFVKFSCTENWSIQSLKKTLHRFQLCQILQSDRIDWVQTTQMGDGRVSEGGTIEGNGASHADHVIEDAVPVKTLLTRVVAVLDETMSAKFVSMELQSRWSKPTRSRRCCHRLLVVAAGLHCDVTSCLSPETITHHRYIDRYIHLYNIYVTHVFESKLFRLPKPWILMTSFHCYIILYSVMATN